MTSRSSALVVSMAIGMDWSAARNCRSSSRPDSPGMRMSSSTASGRMRATMASPAVASPTAATTSMPRRSSSS